MESVRVLVPLDGSATAEAILTSLVPLGRLLPMHVTLFEVVESPRTAQAGREYLKGIQHEMVAQGLQVCCEVGAGRPGEEIACVARSRGSDLVAMTTHGRSGLSRLFMGSVTEEVLARARSPVLVTRPGLSPRGWTRMLAVGAGDGVYRIARAANAVVHVLRVDSTPAGEEAPPEGLHLVAATRHGEPAHEILAYAEENGVALIGLADAAKTVVGKVVRNARCPVLVRPAATLRPAGAPASVRARQG